MKKFHSLVLLVVLLTFVQCEDMHFGRAQVCIEPGINTCNKWNTTVDLTYYYYSANYMCFPASTRVMTSTGPKKISQIRVGDELLSYDFPSGKNVYSPVIAWLHRDTDLRVQFTNIKTLGGNAYRASAGHNIGYNKNGTISFKYADELKPGDELISISGKYVVESSNENIFDTGLYSPVTATGNFYIYPYQSVQANDLSRSMILVHCLAQVKDPHKQEDWIYKALSLSGWVGLNFHQNQQHEAYLHPITHLMTLFNPYRKVKVQLATGDEKHLQSLNYNSGGSSSWGNSWGGSSSYWGSSSYPYYGNSYYYNNNQQRKQNRKRQLVAIFACLMEVNSVITSV